jgi:hypothetical protein
VANVYRNLSSVKILDSGRPTTVDESSDSSLSSQTVDRRSDDIIDIKLRRSRNLMKSIEDDTPKISRLTLNLTRLIALVGSILWKPWCNHARHRLINESCFTRRRTCCSSHTRLASSLAESYRPHSAAHQPSVSWLSELRCGCLMCLLSHLVACVKPLLRSSVPPIVKHIHRYTSCQCRSARDANTSQAHCKNTKGQGERR